MVIEKRVEDLQLAVESYLKKINVTKPKTTRPDIRKRDPYTPYQDPQGFIYIENQGRNRLMCSNELYKFSDGTLTRLRTSLEDITKNIHMEYLPKRRWISLEKKRAHIMIKAINKLHKERRMMRSLEKFIDSILQAGNPINEALIMSLPDHRYFVAMMGMLLIFDSPAQYQEAAAYLSKGDSGRIAKRKLGDVDLGWSNKAGAKAD
ncbi:hypothetical protein Tco_0752946 [Tanacetum coccineum]